MDEEIETSSKPPKTGQSNLDWVCSDPQCGNINFARRGRCNRCNKEKGDAQTRKKLGLEIGKAFADKSRGLFSADDWQCTKCGNVNWARRQQCNLCNAPKYGDVEERTGYGGGYNDRGVVEYIKRDDSDEEYDEFGRKKKLRSKRRNGESKSSDGESDDEDNSEKNYNRNDDEEKEENKNLKKIVKESKNVNKTKVNNDEEEDDDDEDEDDEDLSKYDLSGWGDDDEKNESTDQREKDRQERNNKTKSEESRDRSRSPPVRNR